MWLVAAALFLALLVGVTIARGNAIWTAVLVVLPLLLRWPVPVALGAYVLLVPFEDIIAFGATPESATSLLFYVGAATAAVLLVSGLLGGRLASPSRATQYWILFGTWAMASTLWAMNTRIASDRLLTVCGCLFLYVIASSVRMTRREVLWIVLCVVLGGCVAAGYATYLFYSGGMSRGVARASLLAVDREADPNVFALALLQPLALALGGFLAGRGVLRSMALTAAIVLITLAILLSMSRGSLVAILVMVIVYVWRLRLRWRLLVPLCLGVLLLTCLPDSFFERIQLTVSTRGAGRLDIWEAGIACLQDHALIGAGLGNFPVAYNEVAGRAAHFRGFNRVAHNIYLGTAVELGLVGILLFGLAVVCYLRTAARSYLAEGASPLMGVVAAEAACWSVLAGGFFLDIVWRKSFWLIWIVLALMTQPALDEAPGPNGEGGHMPGASLDARYATMASARSAWRPDTQEVSARSRRIYTGLGSTGER